MASNRRLKHSRMLPSEHVRTLYSVSVEQGTTREDLLNPAFWAHVASQLRPQDRIEVTPETGEYFAELWVRSCGKQWAKVIELRYIELTAPQEQGVPSESPTEDLRVVWRGPRKWSVVRVTDGAVLAEDIAEKEAAFEQLGRYLSEKAA